jgi:hypothetical protein
VSDNAVWRKFLNIIVRYAQILVRTYFLTGTIHFVSSLFRFTHKLLVKVLRISTKSVQVVATS